MEGEVDLAYLGEDMGFGNRDGALNVKQVGQPRLIMLVGLSAVRLYANQMTLSSKEEKEPRQSKFLLRNGAID